MDNLILTDYLEFRFYHHGQKLETCRIAKIEKGKLKPLEENFEHLEKFLKDFFLYKGITIKSSDKLAKMMAVKAQLLQEITYNTLIQAKEDLEKGNSDQDASLLNQYEVFKNILIHDLTEKQFADIYAQTITYGLFAARLNDTSLENFSRQEAAFLVPKTNPFLLKLFSYIAGPDIDTRIEWIVDELADVFAACDIAELLQTFSTEQDPFIHFYETFLAEYDSKLRKSRGVYYTPQPVVDFIVRSVDKILQEEFDLPMGLADSQKINVKMQNKHTLKNENTEIHRVQILDPATGTGTFLFEVLREIYKKYQGQEGLWQNYVEEDLLPRLHGFEILMAPYAMCHLKLGMFCNKLDINHKTAQNQNVLAFTLQTVLK